MEIFETILHLTTPKTAEPASNVKIDSQRGAEEQTLEVRKAIVAGPRNSGRTSLLFEISFQYASNGHSVIFISPRKMSKLPLMFNGRDQPDINILKRIKMVYLETKNEFLVFMASIHMTQKDGASLIIVDDIDFYYKSTEKENELAMLAKFFAFLLDAAAFLGQLRNEEKSKSQQCSVFCSVSTLKDSALQIQNKSVIQMWFKDFIFLQNGENNETLSALVEENEKNGQIKRRNYEYQIKDEKIFLCSK